MQACKANLNGLLLKIVNPDKKKAADESAAITIQFVMGI
jgi:hypothetical protein